MSKQVTLSVSEAVYRQAEWLARTSQRDIAEVLAEILSRSMPRFPMDERRAEMMREAEAFRRQHASLKENYLGEYVALRQGYVVDHDSDPTDLLERIVARYPGQVVLRRKVEDRATPLLEFRSPRSVNDS